MRIRKKKTKDIDVLNEYDFSSGVRGKYFKRYKEGNNKKNQKFLTSVEKEEWKSVKNLAREKKRYAMIARHTLGQDKRINIRIPKRDLEGLQVKAVREGISYRTLITSILHKYVAGQLAAR